MADFQLPEVPAYNNKMRKLQVDDPAHAELFNTLFAQLLENDEYLKSKSKDTTPEKVQSWDEAAKNISDHSGNGAIHVSPEEKNSWGNKANKSTVSYVTLESGAWTGTESPYVLVLSISGVTSDSAIEITLGDATGEQALACAEAQILRITQDAGSLTLYAYGDKPTVDIPVILIFRGDLSSAGGGSGGDTPSIVTEVDPTVPAWAKQSTKPTYEFSEIRNAPEEISNLEIEESIQNMGGL